MAAACGVVKRLQRFSTSLASSVAASQRRSFVLRSWAAPSYAPAPVAVLSGLPPVYSDLPSWGEQPSVEIPSVAHVDAECPEGTGSGGVPMEAVTRTYHPHVIRKKRKHGFLHRNATTSGRRVLSRRARKGRKYVSV